MSIAANKQDVYFTNGNKAVVVSAPSGASADEIVSLLELNPYKAVIVSIGAADNLDKSVKDKLTQLYSRGVARGAAEASSLVIDGGTRAGVMALMGEGVAARGHKSEIIGVAPEGRVTIPGSYNAGTPLEPNHTHFVLVEGNEWGDETPFMFKLVKALTDNKGKIPVTVFLAGGAHITEKEVLQAVRNDMRIVVIEGSGGYADKVAEALKNKSDIPEDPTLAEIVCEGKIKLFSITASAKAMERLVVREQGLNEVLMEAWQAFAVYDLNAGIQQKKFDFLQKAIIALGVVATALVVIQQVAGKKSPEAPHSLLSASELWAKGYYGWFALHNILILIPILLTVLVTAAHRFKQGSKWLLLRAGAESIKREIFRYRTGAMYYKEKPEQQLAKRIEDITRRTMRTEVNTSSLQPYDIANGLPPAMYAADGKDDGISTLTPDRYIELRLNDQVNFFTRKAVRLEKQLNRFYWAIFLVGGAGSFLAAINMQLWVALTTSVVAAFGTYLGYRQTESTLMKYNQAATDLANVKRWWNALSAEEQSDFANIDSLVKHTEQVLQTELDGWMQQMQNALAELRESQKEKYETPKEDAAEDDKAGNDNNKSAVKIKPGTDNSATAPAAEDNKRPIASEENATLAGTVKNNNDENSSDHNIINADTSKPLVEEGKPVTLDDEVHVSTGGEGDIDDELVEPDGNTVPSRDEEVSVPTQGEILNEATGSPILKHLAKAKEKTTRKSKTTDGIPLTETAHPTEDEPEQTEVSTQAGLIGEIEETITGESVLKV